jgi:hypothetical protein
MNPAAWRRKLNKTLRQNAEPSREKVFVPEWSGVPAYVVRPAPTKLTSEKEGLANEGAASICQS